MTPTREQLLAQRMDTAYDQVKACRLHPPLKSRKVVLGSTTSDSVILDIGRGYVVVMGQYTPWVPTVIDVEYALDTKPDNYASSMDFVNVVKELGTIEIYRLYRAMPNDDLVCDRQFFRADIARHIESDTKVEAWKAALEDLNSGMHPMLVKLSVEKYLLERPSNLGMTYRENVIGTHAVLRRARELLIEREQAGGVA